MERIIEMRVRLPSSEDHEETISVDIEGDSIRIDDEYKCHIRLSLKDFDAIAAEVARYRRLQEVANG